MRIGRLWLTDFRSYADVDLSLGDADGFDVLVTTDTNLRYQQNLAGRRIAIVVISSPSWPRVQRAAGAVARAVDRARAGSFSEVGIP